MTKYVKLIDGKLEYPPMNKGDIFNYNLAEDLLKEDGYKPLIETEQPGEYWFPTYVEQEYGIYQVWEDHTAEMTEEIRERKTKEISDKAFEAIEKGYIEYDGALYETNKQTVSDMTAQVRIMEQHGEESYNWLSMDDQVKPLTISDFDSIGLLVRSFKEYIWREQYAAYMQQVALAVTIADIEAIKVEYPKTLPAEE